MLDFRIQTFLCVCRHMNFTHAAKELNITQPAVSQHIHFLEKEYQTQLFSQQGKQLSLTESGKLLLRAAATMHHDDLYLRKQLKTDGFGPPQLNFGATLTVGEFLIPKHLISYMKQHPDTRIQMTVQNTATLLELLNNGIIDFALVEGNFPKEDYDFNLYRRERFIPVCAASHCFKTPPIRLSDLTKETLIIREKNSGGRRILSRAFEDHNLSFHDFSNLIEISDILTIKELTAADCGITFLYEASVTKELAEGRLKTFDLLDFQVIHDINFIWRKRSAFSKIYQEIFHALA